MYFPLFENKNVLLFFFETMFKQAVFVKGSPPPLFFFVIFSVVSCFIANLGG